MAKKRKQKISVNPTIQDNTARLSCPVISVIIPMYNAEKYVAECLDSILAQTFQDFEVIVVDDCSTDSSPAIVEGYKEKFGGRLTLSRMDSNTGSGAMPRNKGMMLSRGEYIQFLDADDTLTKSGLEEMYTLAKDYDAEVVYCEKHYETDADGGNIKIGTRQSGGFVNAPTFETYDLSERVSAMFQGRIAVSTCFKFVRRNFMLENEIFFPHVCPSEDDIWTYSLVFYAKNFLRVPNAVYVRRHSEGSVMRRKKTPQQIVKFWSNPLLLGLKSLDKFMSRIEFFQQNPIYHYAMLSYFIDKCFKMFFKRSMKLQPIEVYETIKQEFGDRLGEHDVLISALCTALNTQQKINAINIQQFNQFAAQAQQRITELETQLQYKAPEFFAALNEQQKINEMNIQRFNQFAAQAQQRIAELEEQLKIK